MRIQNFIIPNKDYKAQLLQGCSVLNDYLRFRRHCEREARGINPVKMLDFFAGLLRIVNNTSLAMTASRVKVNSPAVIRSFLGNILAF